MVLIKPSFYRRTFSVHPAMSRGEEPRCLRAKRAFLEAQRANGWPAAVSDAGHRCGKGCAWWCFPQDRSMYVCRYSGNLHACTPELCPGPHIETLESSRVCVITGQEHAQSNAHLSFKELERYSYALARPQVKHRKGAPPNKPQWTTQEERAIIRMLNKSLITCEPDENRETDVVDFVNRCRKIHTKLPRHQRPDGRRFVFSLAIWLRESPRDCPMSLLFKTHLKHTTAIQGLFPKELRKLSKAQKHLLTFMRGTTKSLFVDQGIPVS